MKNCTRYFAASLHAVTAAILLLPGASQASTTTTLLSQDFSGSFPPAGWSANIQWFGSYYSQPGWARSSGGANANDGCALAWTMWAYSERCGGSSYGPITLTSPSVTGWAPADSQFVDFDLYMPYNYYERFYGQMGISLTVNDGSTTLLTANAGDGSSGSATWFDAQYGFTDPVNHNGSSYWRHYHIALPAGFSTHSVQFKIDMLYTSCYYSYWYTDDVAIDNVVMTNVHYDVLSVNGPSSLNFGAIPYQTTAGPLYTTFTNNSSRTINLSNVAVGGPNAGDFTVVYAPTSVAVGVKDSIGVIFTPQGSGGRTGALTFNTDADLPKAVSVALTGFGQRPSIAFAPGLISFFSRVHVPVRQSMSEALIVTNTGPVPLHVSNASYITGDAPYASFYTITRIPPAIAPGESDSVVVMFSPMAEGKMAATLFVASDADNGTISVPLVGVGIMPHLEITQSAGSMGTLAFDSVAIGDSLCQSLTLHNTGSDTLKILNQIVTYGDYDYTFYPLTGTDVNLPPDASKIVNICFKPIARGARVASIRFYTNIQLTYPDNRDTSQFLISVTGTGVPYGVLSLSGAVLDSALLDSTVCNTVMIKNSGLSDLRVDSSMITGSNASGFTFSGASFPMLLPAGTSVPVSVCFKTSTRGPETATLVVNGMTSGRPLTQSLPLEGVGLAACLDAAPSPLAFGSAAFSGMTLANTENDTCITVTNCGDVSETFSAALSPGTSNAYSLIAPFIVGPIAPGGTGTLCVAFKPDTIGIMPGSVIVSASEKAASTKTLPLAGTGAGVVISGSGQGKLTSLTKCDTFAV
ncbi:MAG: choice-of-anchor D domain-containing protein, partial [Bacteroidota bacterium]|nr:choice-of-anchor D domain-containing protein [Bacteroidota bacterium]